MPAAPFGDERLSADDFGWLRAVFEDATGIALSADKESMVTGRLITRARSLGLVTLRDYLHRARRDATERGYLIDALTTHETSFFREPAHFDVLTRYATGRATLKVWSAACSTGEEAASIAMTLADVPGLAHFEVLGTDISAEAVRKADAGLFPLERAAQLTQPRLHRFCQRGTDEFAGTFRLTPSLAARLRFAVVNLLDVPSTLGQFDVIFLRNVLIYFDDRRRKAIVQQVLQHLTPGGLLLPGHAETVRDCSPFLQPVGVAAHRYLPVTS